MTAHYCMGDPCPLVPEVDRLLAKIRRLRAIEAAARDAMRQIDRTLWLEHETGFLHDLRNNARICDLRVALAAKEGGNGKA